MKGTIPLPEGLTLPETANTQPFSLTGKFLLRGGKLLPLELGGVAVPCDKEYGDDDDDDEGKEPDGCCGAYKTGEMCPDCPRKGGGFLVAIERAMKPANLG